jgi:hypothetical protein
MKLWHNADDELTNLKRRYMKIGLLIEGRWDALKAEIDAEQQAELEKVISGRISK